MFNIRNSNIDRTTALAVTYSTLAGTTAIISSGTVSSISTTILRTNGLTGSTLTGSTIIATTLTTSTLTYSTITCNTMYLSTLLLGNTLGIGSSFVITNGNTTGTTSTISQYPVDVSGTARTTALQYYDNSASYSEQTPLNYTMLGQTWTPSIVQAANWTSIAMSANGQNQVACVLSGGIWYSSTYGQSWTQSPASSLAWYSIALSGSGQYACACVSSGSIWYSSNYGQTWTTSGVATALWQSIVISTNGQYACACASSGALWYSSTYGQSWTQSTTSGTTSVAWSCITMSATGKYVYACINGSGIWYSTTYGQTWIVTTVSSSAWSSIATSANGQYASACVNGGLIWYSNNYGQTWTSTATSNTWGSIILSASGQYQLATTTIPSLLYNYRFNVGDTNGSSVLNYATGQYDGALMNSAIITTASYKTGAGSLSLTASNSQYVNLPPFTMTASITALTFACWINLNSSIGNWARVFDMSRALKGTTFSGTSYSFLCGYTIGLLNFYAGTETNAGTTTLGQVTTPYTPSTGTWTHLAWVLTSSSWTIYINGSAVTPTVATAITQYLPPTGAYPYFFFGRSSWVGDVYAYGNFNDFRMYSSALTASQVSAIYNSGNGIIGSQIASTNFGSTWTTTTGAQGNWQGLAMSSSGQYTTGCINNMNIIGNGILTSVVPIDRIVASNVATVTENTATTMVAYNDGSVSQIAQTPLGSLDYNTFGQTWTTPAINKSVTTSPTVAVSSTGQVQTVSTNPALLSPSTIMSGLQLWFDASDPNGTGVMPGAGTITSWIDKSGNGRNAAVTGTFTVIPNAMNGLPVVSMTNTLYANATSYATATVNGTIVFPSYFNVISVYKVVTAMQYSTPWTYTIADSTGYPLDQSYTQRYINNGSNASAYNIGSTTNTVLVTQLFNPTYVEYLNGSTTASLTVGGLPNSQATSFIIGTRPDRVTSFNGYMCEIIAYNTYMSTANQQVLEGYLAWKWGIQGNLPAAHPYKFINPLAPISVPFSLTSGLQLWLDASTLNLANGAAVSSWPTSGGTPYTFTSSNATYVANAQNGRGVVSFGAGQSGTIANFVLAQTQTIFMLTYAVGQNTTSLFLEHGPNTNNSAGFYIQSNVGENYSINTGGFRASASGTINPTVTNTWQIVGGVNPDPNTSNQIGFYINGATPSGTVTGTQSGTTPVTATLYFNNPSRVSYACYLAEILIYNVALTKAQRQQVEGYLAWKWSIQGNLPAAHPYKLRNPSAPTTIPFSLQSSLQLWLDASKLTIPNGSVVSSWPTSAGTPYTFTSSNATYLANAQNGLGVVYFGAGQSGTIPNFALGQTQTIFMLTYAVGQTSSAIFLEHSGTIDGNAGFLLWTGNSENYIINSGSSRIAVSGANVTAANTWLLLEGTNPDPANSNKMSFYLNGALYASGTGQSQVSTVTNTLYFNNTSRVSQPSYLAELLIYNVVLSSSQRQQVEGYLMHKWGLQSNLPAGHPFKTMNPSNTIVSTNYGQSWIVTAISSSNWASMALSINAQYQVACITGGSIWYSSTSGSIWVSSNVSSLTWVCIVMSGSGQYASACASGGAIWYSSTYGQTWTASTSGSYAWSCITMSISGEYQFACHTTSSGVIMFSTNYGQTWTLITGTTFGFITTLCCSASGQYVIAGSSTGIYYSANYGMSWIAALSTSGPTWSSIKCTASGQYVLGTNSAASGSAYVSTNYGQTWTIISNTAYTCGSSALSASGQYLLLATPNQLYQSVTRIGAISIGSLSQQAITFPTTSYNIGSNSYSTLPGGIILQTGLAQLTTVANAQVSSTVTFPKSFPTACCSIVLSVTDTGPGYSNSGIGVMPQLITAGNFLCMMKYFAGGPQAGGYTVNVFWQAIGY